jgi:preprotein translocase subunit SecG
MSSLYLILTAIFIIVAVSLILIILVQRPAGGGLAGAFGGAGGGGTESVFGGRVGDALTVMTVIGFCVYLGLAITLNLMESRNMVATPLTTEEILLPESGTDPFEPTPGVETSNTTTPASDAATTTTSDPAPTDEGVFTPLPEGGAQTPASDGEGN